MVKIIMHIDINQFFAACAILKEPDLKGKPLVIAHSSRRSIVSTASYEARKYGINSAMPLYLAKKRCPEVIIREPDFDFYFEKSHEFINYIKTNLSKIVEQVSIDEAFVDVSDALMNLNDPVSYIKEFQLKLLNEVGLATSIGLAPTKFLAKMGSDYQKPLGLTLIRKKDIVRMLYPLPIEDFYGIGKRTTPRLKTLGIYTIGDFALSNNYQVKKMMGKFYEEAQKCIHGESDDNVITETPDPKSISSTSTFEYNTDDYEEISNMLALKTHEVVHELEKNEMCGKTLTLILKDPHFKSTSRSVTLDKNVSTYDEIYPEIMHIYDKYYVDKEYRLVGVGVSSLMKKKDVYIQISLFDQEKVQKECKTRILVNKLNLKANKDLFKIASKVKKDEAK